MMRRFLLCQALVLLCAAASAQPIHKWTDENGRVHYGDRHSSPEGSPVTSIKSPTQAGTPAPTPAASAAAPARDLAKAPWTEPAQLQACLVMARAMADSKNPTPAQVRAQSKELLALCPDTSYDCVSYLSQPERNACKAVPFPPSGAMVSNRTYR